MCVLLQSKWVGQISFPRMRGSKYVSAARLPRRKSETNTCLLVSTFCSCACLPLKKIVFFTPSITITVQLDDSIRFPHMQRPSFIGRSQGTNCSIRHPSSRESRNLLGRLEQDAVPTDELCVSASTQSLCFYLATVPAYLSHGFPLFCDRFFAKSCRPGSDSGSSRIQ